MDRLNFVVISLKMYTHIYPCKSCPKYSERPPKSTVHVSCTYNSFFSSKSLMSLSEQGYVTTISALKRQLSQQNARIRALELGAVRKQRVIDNFLERVQNLEEMVDRNEEQQLINGTGSPLHDTSRNEAQLPGLGSSVLAYRNSKEARETKRASKSTRIILVCICSKSLKPCYPP